MVVLLFVDGKKKTPWIMKTEGVLWVVATVVGCKNHSFNLILQTGRMAVLNLFLYYCVKKIQGHIVVQPII